MKIWPWSTISELRRQLRISKAQTEVCGLAAVGAYTNLNRIDNCETYSSSLVEVMALRRRYEALEKGPFP